MREAGQRAQRQGAPRPAEHAQPGAAARRFRGRRKGRRFAAPVSGCAAGARGRELRDLRRERRYCRGQGALGAAAVPPGLQVGELRRERLYPGAASRGARGTTAGAAVPLGPRVGELRRLRHRGPWSRAGGGRAPGGLPGKQTPLGATGEEAAEP